MGVEIGAGRLRHVIDIEQRGATPDTFGQTTESWTAFAASVRAAVEPLRGRELIAAQAQNAETTHKITIRYRAGIDPTAMRVKFGTRFFRIVSALDVEERHRTIEITAIEMRGQAGAP